MAVLPPARSSPGQPYRRQRSPATPRYNVRSVTKYIRYRSAAGVVKRLGREQINIGRRSPAFPVTPPYVRVRIRRFGGLSYRPPVNLGIPSESK